MARQYAQKSTAQIYQQNSSHWCKLRRMWRNNILFWPKSIWTAVTEDHRLGGLQITEIYFSYCWRLGSPRSRRRQMCCLVRTCFLVHGWPSLHCVLMWQPPGLPWCSAVKNTPANAGDAGSVAGWRRSPREGNGNPLQYSCLQNPMDRGAWRARVHEVAKSRTRLSD